MRNGYTQQAACGLAGICTATLAKWLTRGKETDEQPYLDFVCDFQEAEAQAEVAFTDVVRRDALERENWQAATWWLSRRRKADYAPKHEVSQESKVELKGVPTIADAQRIMREEFGGVTPENEENEE